MAKLVVRDAIGEDFNISIGPQDVKGSRTGIQLESKLKKKSHILQKNTHLYIIRTPDLLRE